MKNLSILILKCFFLSLTFLWEVRQGISCSISLSLTIIDLEVVLKEFLSPADLTKAQAFLIYELTKIVIVNKNEDLVFTAFQVVASSL